MLYHQHLWFFIEDITIGISTNPILHAVTKFAVVTTVEELKKFYAVQFSYSEVISLHMLIFLRAHAHILKIRSLHWNICMSIREMSEVFQK